MLIVVFCVLYFRYLDAKADGRLDDGIDPPWMKDVAPRSPRRPSARDSAASLNRLAGLLGVSQR